MDIVNLLGNNFLKISELKETKKNLLANDFNKKENFELALLAELTMNHDDMFFFTQKIIQLSNGDINEEEIKVCVNAYKIKAANLRAEIRALISM